MKTAIRATEKLHEIGQSLWLDNIKGGKLSVTIRRPADTTHENTVKLIFRTKGSVQDVFLQVRDLETNRENIVTDISRVVGKELRGAVVYDRTVGQDAED